MAGTAVHVRGQARARGSPPPRRTSRRRLSSPPSRRRAARSRTPSRSCATSAARSRATEATDRRLQELPSPSASAGRTGHTTRPGARRSSPEPERSRALRDGREGGEPRRRRTGIPRRPRRSWSRRRPRRRRVPGVATGRRRSPCGRRPRPASRPVAESLPALPVGREPEPHLAGREGRGAGSSTATACGSTRPTRRSGDPRRYRVFDANGRNAGDDPRQAGGDRLPHLGERHLAARGELQREAARQQPGPAPLPVAQPRLQLPDRPLRPGVPGGGGRRQGEPRGQWRLEPRATRSS